MNPPAARILELLGEYSTPLSSAEIARKLDMSVPRVAHHIGVLRKARRVRRHLVHTGKIVFAKGRRIEIKKTSWSAIRIPEKRFNGGGTPSLKRFHSGGFVSGKNAPLIFLSTPSPSPVSWFEEYQKATLKKLVESMGVSYDELTRTYPPNPPVINITVTVPKTYRQPRTDDMRAMVEAIERVEATPRLRDEYRERWAEDMSACLLGKALERDLGKALEHYEWT